MEHHFSQQKRESELLLTPKGTTYHLDLHPQLLPDTIITVGDPARVATVSKYFDKIVHKSQHREFVAHIGYLGKKQILVVSTGIGPDNVDIVLNELDALANIDFSTRTINDKLRSLNIIRLGTCGSLQKDIEVGSLVTSSYGIGMDNLLQFYRYENNADECFIMDLFIQHTGLSNTQLTPYIAEGSISLRKFFTNGFLQGITVTCPGFYGPQSRNLRADISYPYLMDSFSTFDARNLVIANFEMETAAMYGLAKILNHHCCSISTVVNNRITNKVSSTINDDIEHMIKHSLSLIEQIP